MKKQVIIICFLVVSSITNIQAQEGFIGEIRMFAGNFPPRNWAFCDGQLLAIGQNNALFSIVGTMYGGNGETTFGLPDLRGRFAMHAGDGPDLTPRVQGQRGGSERHTLIIYNLPSHNHEVKIPSAEEGDRDYPIGNYLAGNGINGFKNATNGNLANFNTASAGNNNNQSVNHMPPYTTVHYIICLQGFYPTSD